VLTFYGDNLTAVHGLPKKVPRGVVKVLYFLKTKPAVLGPDPAADLLVNEMGPEPLDHLEKLLSDVFLPLLSNPANQDGWGEVASSEIVDRMHGFLANVSITVGQTRGETCLPLPPLDVATAAAVSTKDRVHLLEGERRESGRDCRELQGSIALRSIVGTSGALITWTKQIKNVLKQASNTFSSFCTPPYSLF
jgi:dynein heavy chain, axonemal